MTLAQLFKGLDKTDNKLKDIYILVMITLAGKWLYIQPLNNQTRYTNCKYGDLYTRSILFGDNHCKGSTHDWITFMNASSLDFLEAVFSQYLPTASLCKIQISSIIFSQSLGGVSKVTMLMELCLNFHFDSTVSCVYTITIDWEFVNYNRLHSLRDAIKLVKVKYPRLTHCFYDILSSNL